MSVFTSQASVSSSSFIAKCCLAVSTSAAAVSRTNENFGLFIARFCVRDWRYSRASSCANDGSNFKQPQTRTPQLESLLLCVARWRALVCVAKDSFHPTQFGLRLLDQQLQHPHGFMIRMTDFAQHVVERGFHIS